jgi:fermentation-respiration switch protein FrsA (DUF1100 family)
MLGFLENRLVYHPISADQEWHAPSDHRPQDVALRAADGTSIHAWWYPRAESSGAVLYCHGNAGNLSHRHDAVAELRAYLNESVLIFDYPGYGKSEGRPSEPGCYAAAEAAYDWLVQDQRIPPPRLVLFGGSLGGGVAVELACRRDHRALILINTFTSVPDVGKTIYPWLPLHWLMRNRFDNLAKIGRCRRAVLIAGGTADQTIPITMGERLFAAANEPKVFFRMEGRGHNDSLPTEFYAVLRDFLAGTANT